MKLQSHYLNYPAGIHKEKSYKRKGQKKNKFSLFNSFKITHPNWRRRSWRRKEIEIDLSTIKKKMKNYSVKP